MVFREKSLRRLCILICFSWLVGAVIAQEATPEITPVPESTESPVAELEAAAVITETIPFDEAYLERLQLPEGFEVTVFASGLGNVRMMALMPDAVILATRREEGDVIALIDADNDGHVDDETANVVASDLSFVHGITLHENWVYLATDTKIFRAEYLGNGRLGTLEEIVSDLPAAGQHPNRTLHFGPDALLYVSIGSTCNACDEPNPEQATILRMQADGSNREIFAEGLRNTIGFVWHPVTEELWGMDHGSDWRGNEQPPEELNRLEMDTNYGWPFCFSNQQPDLYLPAEPPSGMGREAYCETTTAPILEYTAHSAPIDFLFYTGGQFPAEYLNDGFIAMRGSWNRNPPSGYKLVRLTFDESGQPTGFEDFLTGFLIEEDLTNFGRIAGLVIAADGALLLSEDTNGVIYRISYQE